MVILRSSREIAMMRSAGLLVWQAHEIARSASARLRIAPYPTLRSVSCECDGQGVLLLRGRLHSFYQKQLAQEMVAGLPGVTRVVNHTEVAG